VSYGQNSKDDQATNIHSFFHYVHEAKVCEFQISGNLSDHPTFDEYSNGDEQIPTSNFDDLSSIQSVYDSYGSDFNEDIKEFQECTINIFSSSIKEQHYVEINYLGFVEDIEHDGFNMVEYFISSSPFVALHEQKIDITYKAEEVKLFHQKPIHFEQRKEVFSYELYDPIATYLEEFIYSDPLSWFHCKCEFHNPLLFDVKHSIPKKYVREVWLVNMLHT
jgi:hypothetical protein